MNKLRFGMLTATIASLSAFVPIAAFGQGSNGACWGSETQEFAQTGTLGEHSSDTHAGGDVNSRTSAQDLGLADRPGREGLGNLQQAFGGFDGLIDALTGETCP